MSSSTPPRADAAREHAAGSPWRPRAFLDLLVRSAREAMKGGAAKEAAILAYTLLFALGPLLVLAIAAAGLFFGEAAAREAVIDEFSRLTGGKGGQVLTDLLEGATRSTLGIAGTALGVLALLLFAGLAFAQLKWSLNRIWGVKPRDDEGWKRRVLGACRRHVASLGGLLGAAFLLLVSLLAGAILTALGGRLAHVLPEATPAPELIHLLLSALATWALFAALFKFIPDAEITWRDVTVGAGVTTALFLGGQLVMSTYFARGTLGTAFGAASGVLVLLVWVYYSSLILLYGAQFTQVYANVHGSCVHPDADAEAISEDAEEAHEHPARKGMGDAR